MKILAVETSTKRGSVALITEKGVEEDSWDRAESHSEILTQKTEALLEKQSLRLADVDYFASGVGPGSFTGIRVGVNFAKTCCFINKKPAIVANSLELLAVERLHEFPTVVVALLAFRNLIYVGKYCRSSDSPLQEVMAPTAISIEDFQLQDHSDSAVIGDLPLRYPKVKSLRSLSTFTEISLPKAASFRHFAFPHLDQRHVLPWNEIVPLYVRASEAEEKLRESLFKPT